MKTIEALLQHIVEQIQQSSLSDAEKADIYAQLDVGMHQLVWPILLSHIPSYLLDDAINHPQQMSIEKYGELIESAMQNPATGKELHDELIGALTEVDDLIRLRLEKTS